MVWNTFIYYTFYASAILVYGIGLNRFIDFKINLSTQIPLCIRIIISIVLTSVISWLIGSVTLTKLNLTELYPLVCFLVYIVINTFLEALIRLTTSKSTSEFIIPYLIILLSASEGTNFLNTLIIAGSCLISILLFIPFLYSFIHRIAGHTSSKNKEFSLFFVFLAILLMVLYVWDINWLNTGVLK